MSTTSEPRLRGVHAFAKLRLDDGRTLSHAAVASHLLHLRQKYDGVQQRISMSGSHGGTHELKVKQSIAGGGGSTGHKTTIALVDESENLWHGAVRLGGHTVQVDFDTGSADLIVNKEAYTPGATAKDTGKTFNVQYSDLTKASGKVYTDVIDFGGGVQANACAFGWAQTAFIDVSEGDSGIAGMAFASLSKLKQKPFIDTLISASMLAEPTFTFALRAVKPTLTIGGVPDDIVGTPLFVDVDASKGFWSTSAAINGIQVTAIHDTGSGLIVAPVAVAKALFAKLKLRTFTASNGTLYAYLPSASTKVKIQIGAFTQTMSTDTLTSGTGDDGEALLSIVGADIGVEAVVLGDPWFRNVVAVFSHGAKVSE